MKFSCGRYYLIFEYGRPNEFFFQFFNWLPKESRFYGLKFIPYDSPAWTLGFWYFNVAWCSPWTKWSLE